MNKLYEENDIQNIANAIRGKNGSTDTYKVSEMASAINDIPSGGNLEDFIPEEAFHISGNCAYRFARNMWNWFLNKYGDKITTSDISDASKMFYQNNIKHIPFDINFIEGGCIVENMLNGCDYLESFPSLDFKQTSAKNCEAMFAYNSRITEIGKLSNLYPTHINHVVAYCFNLRHLPEFENLNLSYFHTNASSRGGNLFDHCYSLRKIQEDLLKQFYGVQTSANNTVFYNGFVACYALDEIVGLNPQTGILTSNAFVNTFNLNARVKDVIFAKQEDDTPYSAKWKSQTIDLSKEVGYTTNGTIIISYNSGLDLNTRVNNDVTYQSLKNNPDWFTTDINYSRYNHDSAVNTINSLPDTSEYLASNGGTNTIKFKGESGKLTDGGAINTLTEAEIAVATAKGWTVAFA